MTVTEILSILSYFGITGGVGIAILSIILLFSFLSKNQKLATKFSNYIKKCANRLTRRQKEIETLAIEDMERKINLLISDLQKQTNADNVLVVRYHNGLYDVLGNSLLKLSATNEAIKAGRTSKANLLLQKPRGTYLDFCDRLINEEFYIVENYDLLEGAERDCARIAQEIDANKIYACPLKTSHDNQTIGFLLLRYKTATQLNSQEIRELTKECAIRVSCSLENKENLNTQKDIKGNPLFTGKT